METIATEVHKSFADQDMGSLIVQQPSNVTTLSLHKIEMALK